MTGELFNLDENVVSLIVTQGDCAVENTDCYGVMKRGTTTNFYAGTRDKSHLTQAPTQFTGDTDRLDDAVLVFVHLSQTNIVH